MNNTDMKEIVRQHSRRRRPKRHVFLKGMIIYSAVMLIVTAALVCVGWKYASLRDDALPERAVEKLIARTDASGWRELLLTELPKTYPAYENGEKLAREVLADRFSVGNVTYIKYVTGQKKSAPVFLLLSDGKPMAELTLKNDGRRLFALGEWEPDSIKFVQSYFEAEGVKFRTVTVSVFEGAALTVNGTPIDRDAAKKGGKYPLLLPCEESRASEIPCDVYTLEGIYYEPDIRAELNGNSLSPVMINDTSCCFEAPAGMTRSVSATVPAGVTVTLNGVKATTDWAVLAQAEGAPGELDAGGDGKAQLLDVWSFNGLFFEPEITAEYAGQPLTVLSSDNGKYIFNTPDECRFALTVIVPQGAEVIVNGKKLGSAERAGSATLADLEGGKTRAGLYGTSGFAASSVTPKYDKYTMAGFLAHPTVTATLGGTVLTPADDRTDGYSVTVEFDAPNDPIPAAPASDAAYTAVLNAATAFADKYFAYTAQGGDMGKSFAAFDAAYAAMLASVGRDTPAYSKIMESYAAVYRSGSYSKHETERLAATGMLKYSEDCISITAEYTVKLSNEAPAPTPDTTGTTPAETTAPGTTAGTTAPATTVPAPAPAPTPDAKRSGTLSVLLVKQNGTWNVLSYIDLPAA